MEKISVFNYMSIKLSNHHHNCGIADIFYYQLNQRIYLIILQKAIVFLNFFHTSKNMGPNIRIRS